MDPGQLHPAVRKPRHEKERDRGGASATQHSQVRLADLLVVCRLGPSSRDPWDYSEPLAAWPSGRLLPRLVTRAHLLLVGAPSAAPFTGPEQARSGMSLKSHVAAAILLGAGLQPPAAAVVGHDPAAAQPVCLSRSVGSVASTTTAEDAAGVVREFVAAYNDGDVDRLDELFAPEPDFEWYTVSRGAREEITAYDRAALAPYFARRHSVGDHLKLLDLHVREARAWHGGFDFSFRLMRSSDQRGAEGRYHGKGAADCTIFVWSMGRES